MAESTLSLAKTDYEIKIARIFGFPLGIANGDLKDRTAKQDAIVKDCLESGLRDFYHCGHSWSFLKPFRTLAFATSATSVLLPEDFGGLEGRIYVTVAGSTGLYSPIQVVNPGIVEECYSLSPQLPGN